MGLFNEQSRISLCFTIPTTAAGTDDQHMLWVVPAAFIITAVKFVDYAGIAADDTDYTTLAVSKGTSTVIADHVTKTTGGQGALTAKTAVTVAIETGEDDLAAGDVLFFSKADGGSGKGIDGFLVQIDGYYSPS
jgi:hypothetical protein